MTSPDNAGKSQPLGATVRDGGVNFSLFSRTATGVELLLFDREDDARPARVLRVDPAANRTYHYWHQFVPGVRAGQLYGYRVEGPAAPERGLRFDAAKVLLDPYGRSVMVPRNYDRDAARRPGDTTATAMKSVVVDPAAYDWEGDTPLHLPSARTIIYEMHVRGFTRHPSAGLGEKTRGTYAGLIEKIPYLKDLGVTAVELLPVFQFDPLDAPPGKINWFDWTRLEKHADVLRFLKLLIQRRLLRDVLHERQRVSLTKLIEQANKAWHGMKLFQPDWGDGSHSVALEAELKATGLHFYFLLNAYWEPLEFELPGLNGNGSWRRWIDTALDSPNDITPWQAAPAVAGQTYRAEGRSVVMLHTGGEGPKELQ